eukprot:scaffold6.g2829.t1
MFSREGPPAPGSASAAATGLHRTAAEGPQPETLFRPGATQLAGRGAGGGEREGEAGPELPGFELPTPRYDDEEEAVPRHAPPPPEPENPLPDLPPNHPDEASAAGGIAPKGPEPEVPIPRQDPEADPLAHPPEASTCHWSSLLDTASGESIRRFAAELGGVAPRVDLLINNAGVASWGDLGDVSEEEMFNCFRINTCGPLFTTQAVYKQGLLKQGSVVAQMSSKMGSIDDNGSGGSYAYRASKAALNIVSKSLSIDLSRQGITSVLLHPGYVRTRMVGFSGLIDTDQCVEGLLRVLETKELNGRWWDYKGEEIPW